MGHPSPANTFWSWLRSFASHWASLYLFGSYVTTETVSVLYYFLVQMPNRDQSESVIQYQTRCI